MGVRIKVDIDLCQGHGVCEAEAPDVFELNADRKVEVLNPTPGDGQRREVDLAVKYCPTHALSILDSD